MSADKQEKTDSSVLGFIFGAMVGAVCGFYFVWAIATTPIGQ